MLMAQARLHLLIITVAGLLFALPALVSSCLAGHDFFFHVMFSHHFIDQLLDGELYPRWMQYMNAGFGSPTFFFYAPLPYYITSLFSFIGWGDSSGTLPLIFSACVALIASGVTAYFWLKEFTSPKFALIIAIIYMVLPYHFVVDFYIRFAFAELWSFVWMPWILLLSLRITDGRLMSVLWLSMGLTLLMLTHLPTLIMFIPVFIGHCLFTTDNSKRKIAFTYHVLALILATGLSALYWVPAMTTQEYISIQSMFTGMFYFTNNFLLSGPGYGHSQIFWRYLTFISVLLSSLAYGAWLFSRMQTHITIRREINYWLVVIFICFLMMLPISQFVWEWFPVYQKLQFPWRFNTVLSVAAVTVFALAMSEYREIKFRLHGHWPVVIWCLLLGALLGSELIYGFKPVFMNRTVDENIDAYLAISRSPQEYRPAWVPDDKFSLKQIKQFAAETPPVSIDKVDTSWNIKEWKPRSIVLTVNAVTMTQLTLHHFYYPGWIASIAGMQGDLSIQHSENGLIRFSVPAGQHEVKLKLQLLPEERVGLMISLAATLVWLGLCLKLIRHRLKISGRRSAG